MKNIEIKTIEHKDIKVSVKIDYDNKRISIVEKTIEGGYRPRNIWQPKKWCFAEREIEYMESWKTILEAMEKAITIAQADLKTHIDYQNKKISKLIMEVEKENEKVIKNFKNK